MNAFWEWFYGTPAGYFSMEKSTNMYIVHTKFIPQNCQCAQVYPVHRCRKIFRIQYRTWNLVNKINALHGHWSTHSLAKLSSQSVLICTHFFCFENIGRFVTPVKKVQNIGCKKQGATTQGHCYSKGEEARLLLSFLNNNDPVFLHPAFCTAYFEPFFKVPDPE